MYLKCFEWRPKKRWTVEVHIDDEWIENLSYEEFEKKYNNYYIRYMCETIQNQMALVITKKKTEYET